MSGIISTNWELFHYDNDPLVVERSTLRLSVKYVMQAALVSIDWLLKCMFWGPVSNISYIDVQYEGH